MKEKERISIKHKEDKLKLKEKDYQKHGIELDEDVSGNRNYYDKDESSNEDIEENSEDKSEEEIKEKNKKKKDKKSNKIKININHSTLKEKENAALEILKKKGII